MAGSEAAGTREGSLRIGSGLDGWKRATLVASDSISRACAGGDGSGPSTAICSSFGSLTFIQRPGGLFGFSTSFGTFNAMY